MIGQAVWVMNPAQSVIRPWAEQLNDPALKVVIEW